MNNSYLGKASLSGVNLDGIFTPIYDDFYHNYETPVIDRPTRFSSNAYKHKLTKEVQKQKDYIEEYREFLNRNNHNEYIEDIDNFIKNQTEKNIQPKKTKFEDFIRYIFNTRKLNLDYYKMFQVFISQKIEDESEREKNLELLNSLDEKKKSLEELSSKKTAINYSNYEFKNWRLNTDNSVINTIWEIDGFIALSDKAKIYLRLSKNNNIQELSCKQAEKIISVKLGKQVKITNEPLYKNNEVEVNSKEKDILKISIYELKVFWHNKFNPYILKEYYEEEGNLYRNTFSPTKYMMIEKENYKKPEAILHLIYNLVDYEEQRFYFVINWLACFFQTMKKSQVALILLGEQGSGKGIFFNEILTPLWNHCFTINNESLATKYKGGLVRDKLFINIDESKPSRSKAQNSFIKALITGDKITAEIKRENLDKEIDIYAQILITSNEHIPIEIEESDRRFTVFRTGKSIKQQYLGYGSYNALSAKIKEELEDFAVYLKTYCVDIDYANTALNTIEKRAIINACTDNFQAFANAIVNKDIEFFIDLQEIDYVLWYSLNSDFTNNKIEASNLYKLYSKLYKGSKNSFSNKELMKKLRLIYPHIFDQDRQKSSNGRRYYLL